MKPGRYVIGSAVLLLGLAVLLPRTLNLDQFVTADERRWVTNTRNFTMALAHGEWRQLMQLPHPGMTTQWVGAATAFSDSWSVRKLPLVLVQSALIGIIGYAFYRLWHTTSALLLVALLALNPMLIAHTRVYAMDSFLALFLLLSLALLLLWRTTKIDTYLGVSAVAAALSWLSKLPGLLIVPFTLGVLVYWHARDGQLPRLPRRAALWLLVFMAASAIVLPPLALQPYTTVQNLVDFFRSGDYRELHQEKITFYISTIIFFTTPLQLIALALLATARRLFSRRAGPTREQVMMFAAFAACFLVLMSLGAKKGDRYLLPALLMLDAVTAATAAAFLAVASRRGRRGFVATAGALALLFAGHALSVIVLHPYYLAYVNPLTRVAFGERRLGWGEGLDVAAEYLNGQPHASRLKVATYYPQEFAHRFVGTTVPIHQYEDASVDYVVAYRAMKDRGPEAWETDVLQQLAQRQPVKVIFLNGLAYAWIYQQP